MHLLELFDKFHRRAPTEITMKLDELMRLRLVVWDDEDDVSLTPLGRLWYDHNIATQDVEVDAALKAARQEG